MNGSTARGELDYSSNRDPPCGSLGPRQVLFDFPYRMLGQVLVDLGDDESLHIAMEGAAQFGQGPWRRHDHERGCLSCPDNLLHRRRDPFGEPLLLDVMPVDRLDGASLTRVKAFANPPRPLATLLVSRWIFVLEQPLGLEVRKFLITLIPEKQRFATVADKYECIMWDFQFAHRCAPRLLLATAHAEACTDATACARNCSSARRTSCCVTPIGARSAAMRSNVASCPGSATSDATISRTYASMASPALPRRCAAQRASNATARSRTLNFSSSRWANSASNAFSRSSNDVIAV